MFVGVEKNVVEARIQPVNVKWDKDASNYFVLSKTVDLEKHNPLTPFWVLL